MCFRLHGRGPSAGGGRAAGRSGDWQRRHHKMKRVLSIHTCLDEYTPTGASSKLGFWLSWERDNRRCFAAVRREAVEVASLLGTGPQAPHYFSREGSYISHGHKRRKRVVGAERDGPTPTAAMYPADAKWVTWASSLGRAVGCTEISIWPWPSRMGTEWAAECVKCLQTVKMQFVV